MTIFNSAYNTTATRGFIMAKVHAAVERAKVVGVLTPTPNYKVLSLQGGNAEADSVPQFEHPILLEDKGSKTIVIDVRQFGKIDRLNGQYSVRNQMDYDTILLRGKLDYIWNTEQASLLREVSPLPAAVFASWLSETISRKYYLDPEEQLRLTVLAGYYYQCLFTNESEFDERERNRTAAAVARTVNINAEMVFDVIGEMPVLQNIDAFCEQAAKVTGSVRLDEMNAGLLISAVGGTWFGHNRIENVAVALEHPPTWLALLAACYQSRTYKNTQIAKIAESKNRQNAGSQYLRSVLKMTEDYVGE